MQGSIGPWKRWVAVPKDRREAGLVYEELRGQGLYGMVRNRGTVAGRRASWAVMRRVGMGHFGGAWTRWHALGCGLEQVKQVKRGG
jgi:hypothetical protein